MNSFSKFKKFSIFLITFFLIIEISSWILLKIFSSNSDDIVTDSFIYESQTKNGLFKPNYDWVLPIKKNYSYQWITDEFNVLVKTNAKGLRENFEVIYSSIKILFFGDSFTFGHGVNNEERFSKVFAGMLDGYNQNQIVNFSYKNGFQPEHYEFILKNVTEIRPNKLIIGLYLGNDLFADIQETKYNFQNNKLELPYRLILEKGQFLTNPLKHARPWLYLSKYSYTGKLIIKLINRTHFRTYLYNDGFAGVNAPNPKDLELGNINLKNNRAIKSLIRINKIIKDRQGELFVLLIPQNFYFSDFNPHIHPSLRNDLPAVRSNKNLKKTILKFCVDNNINCIDPSATLTASDYFFKDGHWNANGHLKVGKLLFEKLK
jgi:hypothetical protein